MKQKTGISIFESPDESTRAVSKVWFPVLPKNLVQDKEVEKVYKEKFLDSLRAAVTKLNEQFANFKPQGPIAIGSDLLYLAEINAVFPLPKKYSEHKPTLIWNGRQSVVAKKQELLQILEHRNSIDLGKWEAFVYAEAAADRSDAHWHLKGGGKVEACTCGYNGDVNKFWFPVCYAEKSEILQWQLATQTNSPIVGEPAFYEQYKDYLLFTNNKIELDTDKAAKAFSENVLTFEGKRLKDLLEEAAQGNIPKETDLSQALIDYLLKADQRRADFEPYDTALLTEHTQGHWDLADMESDGGISIELPAPVYARNPYQDIQTGSTIGIDFGTKSTIVSCLDRKRKPIQVPVGGNSGKQQASNYENPTVLHLCDFSAFMDQYHLKAGRPETAWETLTVSHRAKKDLDDANDANYYSFITTLKEWAASENEKFELTDDRGRQRISVPPFLQIGPDDFNPIEIYAYYVGMAINNMKPPAIYTNYLLSFPVTYEKAVREKIQDSFKRGLIKSLPNVLARDESFIERKFRVLSGTSEPAAYAVCALQSYGFEPTDKGEAHYYGVFDFGGGTTDFDFGVWRASSDEGDEEDKDYVIEHFGAGGDKFLGGENLLENLAFTVFSAQDNQAALREKKVFFTFPRGEQQKFPGHETLIKPNSKWANLNMHKMKEILRPLWEKTPDYEKEFEEGRIAALILFKNDGVQVSDCALSIDIEKLNTEIEERIRTGVKDFLTRMIVAMAKREPKPRKLSIFLAGNSCKAEAVKKVFHEECGIFEADYREKFLAKTNEDFEGSLFEIFPPLGTEDSLEKMKERGISVNKDDYPPTGKTGVAIGLVLSRPGGAILVKNANVDESGEIAFRFIVGKNRRGKLFPVLDSEDKLNGGWKKFKRAADGTIEFYYTGSARGATGELDIDSVEREIRYVPEPKPDAYVYIRAVSPAAIEYKVAISEDGDPLFPEEIIKFEEGGK
ncbi:hypothetical protein ACYULU_01065 [Breznakiellaceae bacterium SP9]